MTKRPRPTPNLDGLRVYAPSKAPAPTDLKLDANEGPAPPPELMALLPQTTSEQVHRYQRAGDLESAMAAELGVDPAQVFVGAGGDEIIDRSCRAYLQPGRQVIVPTPTFEMICHFARLAGGVIRRVAWPDGPFPLDAVRGAVGERTGMIVMVSPNNPTGLCARPEDLMAVAEAAPEALVLVDMAYTAFADTNLLDTVMRLPNVLALYTLSKAHGLAGLRIGFAVGQAELVAPLRVAGAPFPVSNLSMNVARRWLTEGRGYVQQVVGQIRREREALKQTLTRLGARPVDGQANFVFARLDNPVWVRDALGGMGIGVRHVPADDYYDEGVRIGCPGRAEDFARLDAALATVMDPEAILFDMDGVLADVSGSYRAAISATAAEYGVELSAPAIATAKAAGQANDDWELTQRLLAEHGVSANLAEVTARFERHYQGADDAAGLRATETLIPGRDDLAGLAGRFALAVVTGRPRVDAERFLREHGVEDLFGAVICREDAPLKPDPAPVRLAMERLGVTRAWMIGDTPDDLRAARAAGVLPIGFDPDGDAPTAAALHAAGAARVVRDFDELKELGR
jgi:histidinol-phosphate aminotransferase